MNGHIPVYSYPNIYADYSSIPFDKNQISHLFEVVLFLTSGDSILKYL